MNTIADANSPTNRQATVTARQWRNYSPGHRDRTNLLLHAVTVPVFCAGNIALVAGTLALSPKAAAIGIAAMLVALIGQGRGHRNEAVPPQRFRSPIDFVVRFLSEQWITFPRYVATGGFARAWQDAKAASGGAPRG